MIILEHANRIVEDTLKERFLSGRQAVIELTCADFDGVTFHIFSTSGKKNELNVSCGTKCGTVLAKYGAVEKLKQVYGNYLVETEPGYDATLRVDLNALPADDAGKESLARSFAFVKRHLFAAPFDHVFKQLDAGSPPKELLDIPYRGAERVFIKAEKDRVTVVFTIDFKDPDDIVLGKVFLQEFKKSIGGAPSVDFTQKDPPGELKGVSGLSADGYVTFVLFDRHLKAGPTREKTIDMIQIFRNYLHYHIKCSKSHLHTRMRNRVDSLLKILNRAKQDLPKQKKTASGRTFKKAAK